MRSSRYEPLFKKKVSLKEHTLFRLYEIKKLLEKEKKKKKKQQEDVIEEIPSNIDPYDDIIRRVNVLITELINTFGTNSPAVDILIDASRELEEIKNTDFEEIPNED